MFVGNDRTRKGGSPVGAALKLIDTITCRSHGAFGYLRDLYYKHNAPMELRPRIFFSRQTP